MQMESPSTETRCGNVQGRVCGDWEQSFRCSIVNSHQVVAQLAKTPAMQEIPARFLGWEDHLEKR